MIGIKKATSLLLAVLILAFTIVLTSCEQKQVYSTADFFAMNTVVSVSVDGDEDAIYAVQREISRIERLLSATDKNSEISKLSSSEEISDETISLLKRAQEISIRTEGAFDYTLGSLIKLWDITGNSERVPEKSEIETALLHVGFEKVSFSEGVFMCEDDKLSVDLGAIAKGYAGDKVKAVLSESGIQNACVSLGGNVAVMGSSPSNKKSGKSGWNVAINNPFDTTDILGTLNVLNKTVSVSGDYERYFEKDGKKYHHIIDRKSGYPSDSGLSSVAVICEDGTLADALSTALFVMGYEKGMELYRSGEFEFEAVFCTNDGVVRLTDKIRPQFTPNRGCLARNSEPISFPDNEN